jgi:hypothetical protein
MCNAAHHDLDDSLDGLFAGAPMKRADIDVGIALANAQQFKMHEERCSSCGGSGRFRSYTGRVVGDCFKCKGAGKLYYRQSLEQREHARELVAKRKANTVDTWNEAHPVEAAWIAEAAPRFEFAASMRDALVKYGHLTERQLAAVTNAAAKSAARKAEWTARDKARDETAATVDVTAIVEAFAVASSNGLKRLTLRLYDFKFKPAASTSRNAGAIYVTSLTQTSYEGEAKYLGKIADGKFTAARDCPAEMVTRIVAAAADPKGAAVAYGKRTGSCCICARELTDPVSVANGIGPICASKYAF